MADANHSSKSCSRNVLIVLSLCVLLALTKVVEGQVSCQNGVQCVGIYECPPVLSIINKPSTSRKELDLVRSLHCGFEGRKPLVCCPNEVQTTTTSTTTTTTTMTTTTTTPPPATVPPANNRCITPDGQDGKCINLYSCHHLTSLLQQQPSRPEYIDFVQKSRCTGPEQFSVCCGSFPPAIGLVAKPTICTPTAFPPEPESQCCGVESGGGNRIVGGNATAIDQYPWLTITEYSKEGKIKLLCGGVLISGRYVVTAGHCAVGPVLAVGTPVNVRLGEYDISNTGKDCAEVEGGGVDCTNGAIVVPIEKIIPHPEYDPNSNLRRHDIALLRLSEVAPYTDFIRPICLPTVNLAQSNPPSDLRLFAAGWGAVSTKESFSNIKLHVSLPFVTQQECQKQYTHPSRRVTLWQGQLCSGGEKGKDSCKGDSGGPLMYDNGGRFDVAGIVSFGPTPCGLDNIPGVYTNVYEYLPWIRGEIKP